MFKKIDFISCEPCLYIFGDTRYKSHIGGVFSLLVSITIMILSGYFIYKFFEKSDFNVIYYKETKNFQRSFNLSFLLYNWGDVNGNRIDPRIAIVTPTRWIYAYSNSTNKIEVIETESCAVNEYVNSRPDVFSFNISHYTCLKSKDHELKYTKEMHVIYYNFYLRECVNTTENNNHCFPKETIANTLRNANMYFNLYLPSFRVDHFNRTNPLEEVALLSNVRIVYDFMYNIFHYFNALEYSSDEGAMFEDFKSEYKYNYDDSAFKSEIRPFGTRVYLPNTLALVQIYLNNRFGENYKRTYPKLQTVLANIGGVLKLILIIGKTITTYITNSMMFVELSNFTTIEDLKHSVIISRTTEKDITTNPISNNYLPSENDKYSPTYRKLSIWEAIFPAKMTSLNSFKRIETKFEEIIKKKLSIENFLKSFEELDNSLKPIPKNLKHIDNNGSNLSLKKNQTFNEKSLVGLEIQNK